MKILITSASTGSGHTRAAQAIETAFKIAHPEVDVAHVNVLDLVSKAFRKIYEDGYMFLADRTPAMWGWLYETTNKKGNNGGAQRVINAFQRNCAAPFLQYLEQTKPDCIVTTHFLIPQILSSGILFPSIPVETVITDYALHSIWINPTVRRYHVADESTVEGFEHYLMNRDRVSVSGIPIHPNFSNTLSRFEVMSQLGLDPSLPTLLLMSGGLGFGALENTVKRLMSVKMRAQIITVSGKNAELRQRLMNMKAPSNLRFMHLGYVNNMHELLSVADVAVTKAGGLTTAECLAKGVPMVITAAIPGQEQRNANFAISRGAAIQPNNLDQLVSVLASLAHAPNELSRMHANALAAGRPGAAFTIADSVLNSFCIA